MKKHKICCFTGHRVISDKDSPRISALLALILEELYQKGCREFRNGGALGFDTAAALECVRLKERHPDVRFLLFLPCREQCNKWKAKDIKIYKELLAKADEVSYVCDFYNEFCMQTRNMKLVNDSDVCVCYKHPGVGGGTAFTVKYALKNEVEIINLTDILP